jgi:hypothetical protein
MKTVIKYFFAWFLLVQVFNLSAKSVQWRYEIEPLSTGVQGTWLIKVWSYTKETKAAKVLEIAKKNAVHGVIFRGFSGKTGIPGQKPFAPNPELETEKKAFFEAFFRKGGEYLQFVDSSGDGIAAEDRIKIGREYKIGMTLSVKKDALRKYLEDAGIIKKLGSGF